MRRVTVVRGARPAVVLMAAGLVVAGALAPAVAGAARSRAPALVRVSSGPITKAGPEHAIEAEPALSRWGTRCCRRLWSATPHLHR